MEMCSLCGKLKSGAETCTDYQVRIQGKIYSPVKYSSKKPTPFNSEDAKMRCPLCGVKPGDIIMWDVDWRYVPVVAETGYLAVAMA